MISHSQTPASFGWTGSILHVNLSDGAVTRLSTPAYSDKYLGGPGHCHPALLGNGFPRHSGGYESMTIIGEGV
jgi:hypothetical protein